MIEEILNKIYTSDLLSSQELHELTEWVCNKDKEIEDIRSKWYDDSEKYLLEIERLNNIINELDKLIEQYSKNDYYYKYNGKYLKSEIINDLKTIRGVDKE